MPATLATWLLGALFFLSLSCFYCELLLPFTLVSLPRASEMDSLHNFNYVYQMVRELSVTSVSVFLISFSSSSSSFFSSTSDLDAFRLASLSFSHTHSVSFGPEWWSFSLFLHIRWHEAKSEKAKSIQNIRWHDSNAMQEKRFACFHLPRLLLLPYLPDLSVL